jgi:predicted permease
LPRFINVYSNASKRFLACAPRAWGGLLSEGGPLNLGALHIQGRPAPSNENPFLSPGEGGARKHEFVCGVGPKYFETVGMTILRGRSFTTQDIDRESGQKVMIVSEAFARYYFGEEDPIGQRFGFSAEKSDEFEIVGVVKDAKYGSLRESTRPAFYSPTFGQRATTFQLRTVADPTRIIAAVRQAAREIDANLPLYNIKTLATQVDESLAQERLIGTLSSFFGLLSLLLAAVGLYGILAYAVSQRTREIGIRIALGARPGAVLRIVLRQGLILTLLGVGFGLVASLGATRLLESQLFDVTPTDPVTFVVAPILLLTVAAARVSCPGEARDQRRPADRNPARVIGAVKGNDVVFGWEMEGNRGTTFTVAFKGTIESATRMTGTVGNPFCGDVGCEWTGVKKK